MSYLRLDRKLLSWGWKDDPNMVALWIHILLEANWKPAEWHGVIYEEGTFPTSVEKLSVATGLSTRSVRTCLEKLKKSGEIVIETTNKGTKITVVKWAEYQGLDEDSDKQADKQKTNGRQTSDKRPTTLKEIEEIEEVEEHKNNTYAQSPNELQAVAKLPLNQKDTYYYITEEDIAHYKELYPAVDVMQEIRNMVGWCEANPTKRKTQKGAPRFINTWLAKAQDRGGHEKKGGFTFFDIDGNLPSLE